MHHLGEAEVGGDYVLSILTGHGFVFSEEERGCSDRDVYTEYGSCPFSGDKLLERSVGTMVESLGASVLIGYHPLLCGAGLSLGLLGLLLDTTQPSNVFSCLDNKVCVVFDDARVHKVFERFSKTVFVYQAVSILIVNRLNLFLSQRPPHQFIRADSVIIRVN